MVKANRPSRPTPSAQQLNDLLPQTQCQLCEFEGCQPYAAAMAAGEADIDRCLPGGLGTLADLAKATGKDPAPYEDAMRLKAKPHQAVIIDEDACIGCTKCIQACPVDAIMGRSKHMHTVITDECSGCELCIAPCPVDCIHIVPLPPIDATEKKQRAQQYLQRYQQRQQRMTQTHVTSNHITMADAQRQNKLANRDDDIRAILARAQQKRSHTDDDTR